MNINYRYFGKGDETIVFIHGLSDDMTYWMSLSEHLKDSYKILLYDIRGHGESQFEYFTIDTLVEDLHDLLLKENIEKATLVGFSLGGNIALEFSIRYPEIVEKLILMATFSEFDEQLESTFIEFRNALNVSFEEFYDVIINYVLPKDIIDRHHEELEFIKYEKAKTANLEAILCGVEAGFDFNCTDRLQLIDAETLIMAGRDDEIVSINLLKILNDNIKNSNLIVFDDTKHNLLIGGNIEEILGLMRKFI